VEELNPKSILDIGRREGRFLGLLNKDIVKKVGVDLALKPIMFARAFHPEIDFHVKDATEINDDFDIITAIEVLEHIPDEEVSQFLNLITNATKKRRLCITMCSNY
jgi:2-polyprenyl-3-methyl-5-hydroxy-6-metoxy-1,4-benzoquinol methylase